MKTGTRSEPGRKRGGIGRVDEKQKTDGRELVVEGEGEGEGQTKAVKGEEQQLITGGLRCYTRFQREDLPQRRGG